MLQLEVCFCHVCLWLHALCVAWCLLLVDDCFLADADCSFLVPRFFWRHTWNHHFVLPCQYVPLRWWCVSKTEQKDYNHHMNIQHAIGMGSNRQAQDSDVSMDVLIIKHMKLQCLPLTAWHIVLLDMGSCKENILCIECWIRLICTWSYNVCHCHCLFLRGWKGKETWVLHDEIEGHPQRKLEGWGQAARNTPCALVAEAEAKRAHYIDIYIFKLKMYICMHVWRDVHLQMQTSGVILSISMSDGLLESWMEIRLRSWTSPPPISNLVCLSCFEGTGTMLVPICAISQWQSYVLTTIIGVCGKAVA